MEKFNQTPENLENKQEILQNLKDFQRDYERWFESSEKKTNKIYNKYREEYFLHEKDFMTKEELSIFENIGIEAKEYGNKFHKFVLDILNILYQEQDVKWDKKTFKDFPENHFRYYEEEYETKLNNNYSFKLEYERGAKDIDGHDYRPTNVLYYTVKIEGTRPLSFKDKVADIIKGNSHDTHGVPMNSLTLKKSTQGNFEIVENCLESFDEETKEKFKEQIIGLVDKLRENL